MAGKIKVQVRPVKNLVYRFAGGTFREFNVSDGFREAQYEEDGRIASLHFHFAEGDSPVWWYLSPESLFESWVVVFPSTGERKKQ